MAYGVVDPWTARGVERAFQVPSGKGRFGREKKPRRMPLFAVEGDGIWQMPTDWSVRMPTPDGTAEQFFASWNFNPARLAFGWPLDLHSLIDGRSAEIDLPMWDSPVTVRCHRESNRIQLHVDKGKAWRSIVLTAADVADHRLLPDAWPPITAPADIGATFKTARSVLPRKVGQLETWQDVIRELGPH
jgi:hypothetical protein